MAESKIRLTCPNCDATLEVQQTSTAEAVGGALDGEELPVRYLYAVEIDGIWTLFEEKNGEAEQVGYLRKEKPRVRKKRT